jgi:hypothetical protein
MTNPVMVPVSLGELDRLCKLASECAEDLEAELRERWLGGGTVAKSSTMQRRFERDVAPVHELMQIAKRVSALCHPFHYEKTQGDSQ